MLEVDWSAEGYNAAGEQVSNKFYFDAVFTLEHIQPGGSATGRIFMTWSEDIKRVTLNTHLIIHNPGTLLPPSELYTIVFSKEWLLANDTDSHPYTVTITFPEAWLTTAPPVQAGQETVEFKVPKELFSTYVKSRTGGMITAGPLPTSLFKGLPQAPIPPPPT
jgi:hypothetical protein